MSEEITFMPDSLDEEPIVFLSMTNSELIWVTGVSLAIFIPLAIVVMSFFGQGVLGIAVGVGLGFACCWLTGRRLRVIKRGKPKGYHLIVIKLWLQKKGFIRYSLVGHSQVFSVRNRRR